VSQGFFTGPKCEFSFDEPIANSSMLVLPRITAPGCVELLDHVRVVGRDEILEDLRPARRTPALRAEEVLVRERDARERPRAALRDARVGGARLSEAPVFVDGDERVERGLARGDAIEEVLRHLDTRHFACGELCRELL
jgi:hypothetical protein